MDPVVSAELADRTVRLTARYAVSVDRLWAALTTPDAVESWLGRIDGEPLGSGSSFTLWHEATVCSTHTVLQMTAPWELTLSWDFPEEEPSTVRFRVRPLSPVGCALDILHTDLGVPAEYAAGWTCHARYLARHLDDEPSPWPDFWEGYDDLVAHYSRQGTATDSPR